MWGVGVPFLGGARDFILCKSYTNPISFTEKWYRMFRDAPLVSCQNDYVDFNGLGRVREGRTNKTVRSGVGVV